jgi:phage replication-related protein YjqB (UPF0714/DUF867 family)
MSPANGYQNYFELSAAEEKRHYRTIRAERGTRLLVFTPHGGGIEPGASEITRALAGENFSYYCFEGARREGNDGLHITSTRFDEPEGLKMISKAEIVITIHGCGSRRKKVFIGGLHDELVERFISAFQEAGFDAETGYGSISGRNPHNLCNRGKTSRGVQIEVSEGLRREMFHGLDQEGRGHTTAIFERFVAAGRGVLIDQSGKKCE